MQSKIVEKTIYLSFDLDKRIENVILDSPCLNLNVIIKIALEEWLRRPELANLHRDCFITNVPKSFGPTYISSGGFADV